MRTPSKWPNIKFDVFMKATKTIVEISTSWTEEQVAALATSIAQNAPKAREAIVSTLRSIADQVEKSQ